MAVLIDRSRERTQHAKKFRRSAAHVRFFASSSRESGDGFSQNREEEEEGVRVLEARARATARRDREVLKFPNTHLSEREEQKIYNREYRYI
jgi:hypothetical protein|tara:strand:- start:2375 stop:2650 length:276 start_codon:yes stop_codon:yes gene_type:complete